MYIVNLWRAAIGPAKIFNLSARIFHAVCLFIMAGTLMNIPFNYLIGATQLSGLMLLVLAVTALIYYLSRGKQQTLWAIGIFQLCSNLLLAVNYKYNAGLAGPTIAIFILTLVVTLATVPKKQYFFWLALNALTFLGLTFAEAAGALSIQNSYRLEQVRFTDFRYTYLMVGALITFILSFVRDAYEQERQEAEHKAAALTVNNQTQNKLLSILAHDLKDPLASLQNYLELLAEYRVSAEERAELEKLLLNRTKQASQLLANVLAWIKSQQGGWQTHSQPVYLQECLQEVFRDLQAMASDKGIDLQFAVAERFCVRADPAMLQVIFRNLLVNAVKFTYPGGNISVTVTVAAEEHAKIMISDTGIGMSPAQLEALFSLADHPLSSGTGQEKGTGLGLLICKNLVELQQGSLSVTSSLGKGTVFTVDLPYCAVKTNQSAMEHQ